MLRIDGTTSGTFTTPLANPDAPKIYVFKGTGNLGDLGAVSVTGSVSLPGFIASGNAHGTLKLSNSHGTVTLGLIGPTEVGFGPFPSSLSFSIESATGAYAGTFGGGSISAKLNQAKQTFAFQFFTLVPV